MDICGQIKKALKLHLLIYRYALEYVMQIFH